MVHIVHKISFLFLALVLLGCGRDGPLLVNTSIDDLSNSLDRVAPRLMEENDVVGLSVAVIRNNEVAISRSFGHSSLESKKPISDQTVYKAASLGKPIFAYVVVSLAQQGKINLDVPLASYCAAGVVNGDARSEEVTARMVLSHTAGLPNLGGRSKLEFLFDPGKDFEYSGHGYQYLQGVVEAITHKSLNELANEFVFEPLSMTKSSYVWRTEYENIISSSYSENKEVFKVNREADVGYAAWSLYTTLGDYSKFVMHIMKSSKETSSIASWLLEPYVDVAKGVKWGMGWGIQDTMPNNSFWHWGSLAGFRHYAVGYPEEKVAVIVMANSQKSFKMVDSVMVESIGGRYPSYDWF